jgi:hypothetical protein
MKKKNDSKNKNQIIFKVTISLKVWSPSKPHQYTKHIIKTISYTWSNSVKVAIARLGEDIRAGAQHHTIAMTSYSSSVSDLH